MSGLDVEANEETGSSKPTAKHSTAASRFEKCTVMDRMGYFAAERINA
jgi:hypothetical protein